MSVSAVGTRGWAARPWQSKASVSVQSDRLTAARMVDLAAAAARHVQDDRGWVSVRERASMRVDLRVRDMVRDDGAEVMQFHVEIALGAGRVTARSAVDAFQVKEGGFGGLVSVGNKKILGYSAYERYMEVFGALVAAEDPDAQVSFTSGK
ncbi:MAG TPA: hypothetical protein VGC04_13800 [Cellulomonas sp.]